MTRRQILDELPPVLRIAMAYAPRDAVDPTLALLALDNRLKGYVLGAREPVLAQIRLAWWRERLAGFTALRTGDDPLLGMVSSWGSAGPSLSSLVDGWEGLLDDADDRKAACSKLAEIRSELFVELAAVLGCRGAAGQARRAGSEWSVADLAAMSGENPPQPCAVHLPRALRPIAVLHGLARRASAKEKLELMDGVPDLIAAIRIGLIGR